MTVTTFNESSELS